MGEYKMNNQSGNDFESEVAATTTRSAKRRMVAGGFAILLTMTVAGCGTNDAVGNSAAAGGNEGSPDDEGSSPADSGSGSSGDEVLSLRLGVRNYSVPQAPPFWAEAEGYFDDVNLDVEFVVGEEAQTAQLVAGQSDVYAGSQGALFGVINAGKQIKTIYGVSNKAAGWVVTSNDSVETPADCVSVTSATPGTVLYAWTRQLERIYDVEWELTQLTTPPAISANVVAGRSDCATGNISYFQSAVDEGRLRVVLDPNDDAVLPPGWPELGVEDVFAGVPETLEENRAAIERFIRAYRTAIDEYMETDNLEIARTLRNFESGFAADSEDVLALSVEQYKPLLNPYDGYVSEDVWSTTLEFFGSGGLDFVAADSEGFDYADAVDMSYYDAGRSQ